ncbi:oligosaccharide flippase family protein [Patescibacteria group bacterium]|nr:oligosaccharide flippase family protein [Patescibacteria group bacterium]
MELEDIKGKTIRSVVALIGRTVLLQAVSLVAFFFLGIFLSPSAIGVFIAVNALLQIFTIFTDVGLGAALIQKKEELDEDDLRTTFTIQEILVTAAVVVGFLVTRYIAGYAHLNSQGIFLYHVLLITLFISSLKALPSLLLERKLAFDVQVIPQIVESSVFNVLVVVLAYRGFEIDSYSWAILVSALVGLPLYYILSPWKVRFGIARHKARALLSYGIAYQGKSVLAVIKDNLLTVFLTGWVGTEGVGYWGWAQRWAYSPFRLIVDSVTRVTFPAYARVQHEQETLRKGIEKSLFAVSFVLFPILTGMIFLIQPIIYVIPKYAKWEAALPSFYFLCLGAGLSAISNVLVNALDATGRVKTTLGLMILWIALTWGFTIVLVGKFGFTGISMASFVVALTVVYTGYLLKRHIEFSFVKPIWKPTFSSVVMGLGMFLILRVASGIVGILLAGITGAIIFAGVSFMIDRKEIMENFGIFLKAYRK